MAARPRKRHLSPKARRALELLASNPLGDTEALMLHGHETLSGLVLAGLATVVTETMKAGAATVKVERYMITDGGRDALAES